MTIRPMRPDDAAAVAELTTQLGYPVDPETQASRMATVQGSPRDNALLVAADEADRPIGWIHVSRVASLEASDLASVNGLVVGDGHRSVGVGAALLAAAEAWARRAGCATILVRSRIQRERAHRFYERAGYARLKTSHVFEKRLDPSSGG